MVGGEVRDIAALAVRSTSFFKNTLPRRGVRLGIGTNRVGVRVLDVDGIDDDAARQRCHVPRARSAVDPDGPGSDGLPRRQRRSRSEMARSRTAWSLPPPTASPSTTSLPRSTRRTSSSSGSTSRRSRSYAQSPRDAASRGRRAAVVAAHRSRPFHACDLGRRDLRLHARARVGRWELDVAIARELGLTTEEAAEMKLALDLGSPQADDDDPGNERTRSRQAASCRPLHANWSRRCSSTREA